MLVSISQSHNVSSKGRDGKEYPYTETIRVETDVADESEVADAYIKMNDAIFNARMEKFKRIKGSKLPETGAKDFTNSFPSF